MDAQLREPGFQRHAGTGEVAGGRSCLKFQALVVRRIKRRVLRCGACQQAKSAKQPVWVGAFGAAAPGGRSSASACCKRRLNNYEFKTCPLIPQPVGQAVKQSSSQAVKQSSSQAVSKPVNSSVCPSDICFRSPRSLHEQLRRFLPPVH